MTYFRDLKRCTYFDRRGEPTPELIAVGWLDDRPGYPCGPADPAFVQRLFELIETVFDPIQFRGSHVCDLCGELSREMRDGSGRCVLVGQTNLFVSATGFPGLYVAPSLILHYVVHHGYAPPAEFRAAVEACPGTGSSAYYRRIEPLLPDTDMWRGGLRGFWNSMGEALAGEAGLMTREQWSTHFDQFWAGRGGLDDEDFAREPPAWVERRWLAPMRALAQSFATRGDTLAARALGAWIESVEWLGQLAPTDELSDP